MKKIKLAIVPLITLSFLVGCATKTPQTSFDPISNETEYFVKFETYGGSHIQMQRVVEGNSATKPTNPTRGNDAFLGWFIDEGFTTQYTFEEIVTGDTILYAKWDEKPKYHHFQFNGTNCAINSLSDFETDIPITSSTTFAIIPTEGYYLPSEITITGEGKDSVTYNEDTGIVSINNIKGDVAITASALANTNYTFTFNGTNCTINKSSSYTESIKSGTKNVQFTILPNADYVLPNKITVTSGDQQYVFYQNGVITISKMVSNFTISATAELTEDTVTINFVGVYCKASTSETNPAYQFVLNRKKTENSVVLNLAPDDNCNLPDTVSVTFGASEANDEDFTYDKEAKTLTIYKVADALISLTAIKPDVPSCTLTFDAGEGNFYGKKILEFPVASGTKLWVFLHTYIIQPKLENEVFGYYYYRRGDSVEWDIPYDYTVTEDITLKPIYFETTEPYDNLDNLPGSTDEQKWKAIKRVAITNPDPHSCFKIGATKKVHLYTQFNRTIRIIGFNHDELAISNDETKIYAGITFEFSELFSDENGNAIEEHWEHGDDIFHVDCYHFPDSTLNHFINGIAWHDPTPIIDRLAPLLKAQIEDVNKMVAQGGSNFIPHPYTTKLFPLSVYELTKKPDAEEVPHKEGQVCSVYEYYLQHPNLIKKDVNGKARDYWLRTPSTLRLEFGRYACALEINNLGRCLSEQICYFEFAISPAFCV